MKFVVGHGGVLVALFTRDDCVESFYLMGRSVLSSINALVTPGAGVLCYHDDAPPFVARCAFYLNLLYHLFQDEVSLQLYGTPYGLSFTKRAMAGSSILLHPANTLFAERMPVVRQNHSLQHQGITKTRRKHGFRVH